MAVVGLVNDMNIDMFKQQSYTQLNNFSVEIQQEEENFDDEC